jgi:Amidohydrolase/Antibiotic biosynthesis monooxygenase
VRRGLAAVQARGLAYDVLVRARELPAATNIVEALPELRFVLDDIAKPRILDGRDDAWTQRMPALAALPNLMVKLSGMITEANWESWTASDLRPFVGSVVDWFTLDRIMFGSDWPVCLLAGSYESMSAGLADALGGLKDCAERGGLSSGSTNHRDPVTPPHLTGGETGASTTSTQSATQESGGRAVSELQGIGRFKFHEGGLEEFKRLAAQCMEIVRAKDTGTLQYDIFFNDDQSECIVLERYRDSEALIEHALHLGDLGEAIFATGWVSGELLGEPSAELRAKMVGSPVRLFAPYDSI